jgi:hypothetical protein
MSKLVAFVRNVPSATFHYTVGDKKVYLNFVDRNTTISYPVKSQKGKYLVDYLKRLGYKKVTYTSL